jgi:hydroxyacylglutathione hydrolase
MRAALLVLLVGCGGSSPPVQPDDGGNPPGDGDVPGDGGALEPGNLTVAWMHGSANCAQNVDPEVQVHAYNATTHIIRQNKCDTFEAPFIYVLLGSDTALVLDSGATNTPAVRDAARQLAGTREILVAHKHAHGDHGAGDPQFTGQPNTTVIARNRAAVETAFAINPWPTDEGQLELGGRVLDVLAIPGHEAQHVAFYDRQTGLLLTGDSLYPGLLFVQSWTEYRTSINRLAQFAASRPVAHVLGAHIEMTSTPRQAYQYGETFQPDEHVLQLAKSHLLELDTALQELPSPPANDVVRDDFVIVP